MTRGRGLTTALLLLLTGAAAAAAAGWAIREGRLPDQAPASTLAALLTPFLAGALLALLLLVGFRAAGRALRQRAPGTVRALGGLEGAAAVVVVLAAALAGVSGLGTALLSAGLLAFGLTLALQRPILSMAGWAAVRFGRLFTEGDRIEVRGIVGDVLEVNLFSTRLWEIGSSESPLPWGGAVSPLRPTGRVVTLPNATFLEEPVANATSDVPVVFDEFEVGVGYEADWKLAERLLREAAAACIDPQAHAAAAREYERLTRGLPMAGAFPPEPQVILSLEESWIALRLRYLVDVRRRSSIRTALARAWQEASSRHPQALPNVYRRVQSMAIGADGRARE